MNKLGPGTKDFIIIRVCAVLILLYSIYLSSFFIATDGVNYKVWSSFLMIFCAIGKIFRDGSDFRG